MKQIFIQRLAEHTAYNNEVHVLKSYFYLKIDREYTLGSFFLNNVCFMKKMQDAVNGVCTKKN